jgi:hypothetical protein
MNSAQQTTYNNLIAACVAKGGSVKCENANYDGSYTVHLNAPDGQGTLCVLINQNGTSSRSWLATR